MVSFVQVSPTERNSRKLICYLALLAVFMCWLLHASESAETSVSAATLI